MYLDCENQCDLKIGMILLDIKHNKEYVIINYNLCDFDIVKDKSVKVNSKVVYNFI